MHLFKIYFNAHSRSNKISDHSTHFILVKFLPIYALPFKYELNHETRKFSRLFHSQKILLWPSFKAFYRPRRQNSLIPFHILRLAKFLYQKTEKGTPFRRSLSVQVILGSTPPGPRKEINLITASDAFIDHKSLRVIEQANTCLTLQCVICFIWNGKWFWKCYVVYTSSFLVKRVRIPTKVYPCPPRGDSHMKGVGMLVANFEWNP